MHPLSFPHISVDRAKKNADLEQELLTKGRTKLNLELTGYEDLAEKANATVVNVVLAVFSCMLFLGSCILCTADIQPQTETGVPLLAAACMIFSIALAIYTVRRMMKKK